MLEKLFSITAYANPTAAPEAMEIAEQAAEAVSNEPTAMTVFGFGFGLVFIGLIAIIIICKIMGAVCQLFIKGDKAATPAPKAQKSKGATSVNIPNKGEFVAAVSAALAEEMGKDVSAIRILSIKKL